MTGNCAVSGMCNIFGPGTFWRNGGHRSGTVPHNTLLPIASYCLP